MSLKDVFNNLFSYKPEIEYNFSISDNSVKNTDKENEKPKKIFPSIKVNKEYMQAKYNTLINSDIVLRSFIINIRGKQYESFILYIDGMVDSKIMNDFIIKPLMLKNKSNLYEGPQNKVVSQAITNNITVKKVKKFNLANYLMNSLIPQNSVKQVSTFEEAISGINSGNCALFVDTINIAFDIELKGFKQRRLHQNLEGA